MSVGNTEFLSDNREYFVGNVRSIHSVKVNAFHAVIDKVNNLRIAKFNSFFEEVIFVKVAVR